jgi:hypothetical protein
MKMFRNYLLASMMPLGCRAMMLLGFAGVGFMAHRWNSKPVPMSA